MILYKAIFQVPNGQFFPCKSECYYVMNSIFVSRGEASLTTVHI